ncbi:MAG: hypothetical protein ABI598_01900 [Chloroflexota bacterium]
MGITGASRDLVAMSMAIVLVSRFVDGPVVWPVGIVLLAAVWLGTLQVLGDGTPSTTGPGVPVEALIVPGVTAVGIFGAIRLVPVGLLLVPALLIGAWLLARVLGTESRLLASQKSPSSADRTAVMSEAMVVGLLAFAGIAALVPGGLPEPGASVVAPTGAQLAVLAGADAVIAFLLGYRAAALRTTSLREVAWFALTNAIVIAIAATALRAMEIPRLLGPALLVLVFFLWDAIHVAPASRRRNARWIWEALLLVVLAVVVVAWSVRLRA